MPYKYNFDIEQEQEPEKDKPKEPGNYQYNFDAPAKNNVVAKEEVVNKAYEETYEPMPNGWNKGEYSSNPKLDSMLAERAWKQEKINESVQSGETSAPVGGLQKVGQMAGVGVDIVGKEIVDATVGLAGLASSAIKSVTSEDFRKGLLDGISETAKSIYDFQKGAGVEDWLKEGGQEVVDYWDSLDKNTRRTLESSGLLAAIVPVRQVTTNVAKGVEKVTSSAKIALTGNLAKDKLNSAIDLIRPFQTGKEAEKTLARTINGKYTPTPREVAVAQSVSDLKGYKVRGDMIQNKDTILTGLTEKSAKLDADIAKYGSQIAYDPARPLGDAVVSLTKNNADFVGVNPKVPLLRLMKANDMIKAESIKQGGLTSSVLHKVRQEYDDIIRERSPKAFSPDAKKHDPILETDKAIRDKLNQLVDESVPGKPIAADRSTVSNLITAKENVITKVRREHEHLLAQAFGVVSRSAKGLWALKTINKLALGGALTGTGVALAANPWATGGMMAALGIGYGAKKIVMSRPTRQALLGVVGKLDEAAKLAKGAEKIEISRTKTSLIKMLTNVTIKEASDESEVESE